MPTDLGTALYGYTYARNQGNDVIIPDGSLDNSTDPVIPDPAEPIIPVTNDENPVVKELEANNVVYDIISKGVSETNSSTNLKMWVGTQQEYDAIVTKDANTLYNIKDGAGDSVATTNGNNTFTGTNNFVTASLDDNTTKVATTAWVNAVVNNKMSLTLLDYKWTDHILNNVSWLRSDTFSWQDGGVYEAAYEHLEDDFTIAQAEQGRLIDDKIIPTYYDVIGSHTIYYWLAEDGHKIITDLDDEQTLIDIYNESGVAWYYLLDTGNGRFKLPRTKHGFVGLRDYVGKYVEPGLPNITGYTAWAVNGLCADAYSSQSEAYNKSTGSLYATKDGGAFGAIGSSGSDSASTNTAVNIDASRSNSIYGNSNTVQPPATQMYLYFYVGQYSQTAIEQTAGIASEALNNKADLDGTNVITNGGANLRNISKWSSNVSNCITEIPQDIKLELNDGTLTLKAGSKVYVPNGFEQDGTTPKFDTVIITNDLTSTFDNTLPKMLFVKTNGQQLRHCNRNTQQVSGTSASISWGYWYDTTNNIIKFTTDGSTWQTTLDISLPIGLATGTNGSVTSIDQVFNGIGYFGSTVFVLPGVKVQVPDGRNADGTLKSIPTSVDSVILGSRNLNQSAVPIWLSDTKIISFSKGLTYDKETNTVVGTSVKNAQIGICNLSSGVITYFNKKNVVTIGNSSDYIIEYYRSETTWYRLYESGWVEQGGVIPTGNGTSGTITLPVRMLDTSYNWQASVSNDAANNFFILDWGNTRTRTTIQWRKSAAGIPGCWEIKGMSG